MDARHATLAIAAWLLGGIIYAAYNYGHCAGFAAGIGTDYRWGIGGCYVEVSGVMVPRAGFAINPQRKP